MELIRINERGEVWFHKFLTYSGVNDEFCF